MSRVVEKCGYYKGEVDITKSEREAMVGELLGRAARIAMDRKGTIKDIKQTKQRYKKGWEGPNALYNNCGCSQHKGVRP